MWVNLWSCVCVCVSVCVCVTNDELCTEFTLILNMCMGRERARERELCVSKMTSPNSPWTQKMTFSLHSFPEGRPGMSDVSSLSGISELSFDSTLLSPLLCFCLVLLPFLSYLFLPAGPFFWTFSRKIFNIFHENIGFFVWLLSSS